MCVDLFLIPANNQGVQVSVLLGSAETSLLSVDSVGAK